MSVTPGSYIGVYEIVAPLGAGATGEVYRARDPKLRRQVAIKILSTPFAIDPERLVGLSHPNILAIHDFGRDGDISYAVMQLLDGHSLRDVIDAGPIPRWKIVQCATQIAKGLEAAHAGGVIHRDLKPENVFVSAANQVKILDFGLAATHAVSVVGASSYMSPEQARGEAADHRSDIFSFGCMLYEMLCGKRAFQGASPADTLQAILHSEPRDLSTLPPGLESLGRIVTRCLEKSPAARFQSARDVVVALSEATMTRTSAEQNRRRYAALLTGVALLLAVLAAWMLTPA